MDSATLADGLRQLAADHSQIHSLLIARHGNIVLDAYAYPYGGSTYHAPASVTKSITTTLAPGAWTDATTFEFEVDEGPGVARYTVRLVVEGETARLDLIGVADEVVSVPGRIGGQ